MFRLHGNGRDQTRPHRHRAVSDLHPPTLLLLLTAAPPKLRARTLTVALPPLALQVQEADGLQAEEAAAADQEAAVSPPAPDDTQGQLSQGLTRSILIQQCGVVVPHSAIIIILMLIAVFPLLIYDTVKGND